MQNGAAYTYFQTHPVQISEGSELDSGDLSGGVLTRASPVDVPTDRVPRAVQARRRSPATARSSRSAACRRCVVRSVDGRPLPVHVDGDHISDEVEVRFTVEPNALRVIC